MSAREPWFPPRRRNDADFLCRECWRYSKGDIPWCGHAHCSRPRWWNVVRRLRALYAAVVA